MKNQHGTWVLETQVPDQFIKTKPEDTNPNQKFKFLQFIKNSKQPQRPKSMSSNFGVHQKPNENTTPWRPKSTKAVVS